MTTTAHCFFAVFILTRSYLSCANADYDQYTSLISDVRNEYRASSVFLVFSKKNSLMEEHTKMHLLSRTFSEDGVFTLMVNFDDLIRGLDYDQNRAGRPLVVFFVKSLDDITEFNRSTRIIDKSCAIWLVIFHGNSNDRFCEYCRGPSGNDLGLRLDTVTLVLCCDRSTLQEWWSIHENRTEIGDLGTWNASARLNVSVTEDLRTRGRDLLGTVLRVVIVTNSQLADDSHDRFRGLFEAVLGELEIDLKFNSTKISRSTGFGTYNYTTKKWSGAVGILTRGEADLAIPVTMTGPRLEAIDFTHPVLVSPFKLFIKKPDGRGVNWHGYFEVFTLQIWAIIIILTILAPLLLAVMKMEQESKSFGSLYVENFVLVWGIFCQQALFKFPPESSMRMAYYSIFVSGIVVCAAYSASMISFITVSIDILPFSNLDDFVKDGSYKLIVVRSSMYYDLIRSSNSDTYRKMAQALKPLDLLPANSNEAWDQVCSDRVALITSDVTKRTVDTKCKVVEIATVGVGSMAIALPAGSQYTRVINYHIERYKANGMIHRLKETYYNKVEPVETTYDIVEFSGVAPILSILAGGVMLAVIVWFCESMCHTYENCRRRRTLSTKSRKNKMLGLFDVRDRKMSKVSRPRSSWGTGKSGTTAGEYYP